MENTEQILARIEKLEFHLGLIAESLNRTENPVGALVVGFNWSEKDLDSAHDIFDSFDKKLGESKTLNRTEFEAEFRKKLSISYQALKSVVLAFYRNGQWVEVCHAYALSFGDTVPIELKSILIDNLR